MQTLLVIDADAALQQTIRRFMGEGFAFVWTAADEGLEPLLDRGQPYDAILMATAVGTSTAVFCATIARVHGELPHLPILALTSGVRVKDAVLALKAGAVDVLDCPVDLPRLKEAVVKAIPDSELDSDPVAEGGQGPSSSSSAEALAFKKGRSMIGDSASIRHVFTLIAKLAKVETSVLIRGESGTGKELVAQALHYNSPRADGPFVSVNCGAIPDTLIESELFGHEKGAFTGADRKKIGKFEYAQGGTIFLDEIGDISAHMQVKLLRVLQEKKFIPLGSNKEVEANVRVVSATNKPLEDMMVKEEFRSDLFYRLNVLPIHLPPLRERKGDIAQLTDFLIDKFNRIHCRNIRGIAADALGALQRYRWPGNIRELENAIEHAFIMEASQQIKVASLPSIVTEPQAEPVAKPAAKPAAVPPSVQEAASKATPEAAKATTEQEAVVLEEFAGEGDELRYPALKERFEKWFLERALTAHNGRINQTAEGTQMTKVTLLRKLQKYGIDPKHFRN